VKTAKANAEDSARPQIGHKETYVDLTKVAGVVIARDERPACIRAFMQALSDESNGWITKGNADASPFITSLLAANNPMGLVFSEIAANSGGLTHRQIAVDWVAKGCPLPDLDGPVGARRTLMSAPLPRNVFPRRRIRGQGAAH
jgi:hypothetical protein